MKYLIFFVLLAGCAHKEMNEKRALKLCRKIYGPQEKILPKNLPALTEHGKSVSKIIDDCYKKHVQRTKDPRDYVSCAMVTYAPGVAPRLTILSTQELLPPEIVIQCSDLAFRKIKIHPKTDTVQRFEIVSHLLTIIKG